MSLKNPRNTKALRRQLRRDMTKTEEILWENLRRKRLGVRVKRQYGIGPYILDFYIPQIKLAIEVDGKIHLRSDVRQKDLNKDAYLKRNEIEVLRFKNETVLNNIESVLSHLKKRIKDELE